MFGVKLSVSKAYVYGICVFGYFTVIRAVNLYYSNNYRI